MLSEGHQTGMHLEAVLFMRSIFIFTIQKYYNYNQLDGCLWFVEPGFYIACSVPELFSWG